MRYTVIIEKGPTSYGAYIPDLPGCIAAGDTFAETEELIRQAVIGHVELMAEHGETIPEPRSAAVDVEVRAPGTSQEIAVESGT
jgi:predicted RNase H-like HicB family nuclease